MTGFLKSPKVTLVLGARQVGKTTLVKHILKNKKALFLNLDNEVDKQRLIGASSLPPEDAVRSFGDNEIIVIDEAQRLLETARIVKGWYDAGVSPKIILLGSSSLNLLNQSAEALTGRNEKLFLPPLKFSEIIRSKSWYSNVYSASQLEKKFPAQLQELLLQSLVYGSYPEAIITVDKPGFILNLVSDYLLKDILQIGLIKEPGAIKRLLMLLAHQIGSEVSVNELATTLAISRITIERYLDLLEQTFVIFRLPALSTNPRKEISKNQKIYFWDTGVRNGLLNELSLNPLRTDIGPLWENWVISEFAKENMLTGARKKLYFWRSRNGGEVDLVIKDSEGKFSAYEIKWRPKKYTTPRLFREKYQIKAELIDSSHPLVV